MTNSLLASFFGKSECGKELTTFSWRNMTTMGMLQRLPNAAAVPTPAPSQRSGKNGGGGSDMEEHVEKPETGIDLKTYVQELRGDIKTLLWAGIGAMGAIICGAWTLYSKLSVENSHLSDRMTTVEVRLTRVEDKMDAENAQLSTLQASVDRIATYLDKQRHQHQ